MRISTRISGLTPGGDDGWGILYKARAMEAAGETVANLTIGEHDIRTAPAILDAMQAAARAGHTGYADVPGIAALRRDVADRVERRTGVPTGPENVLITPGGQAALFAAHALALEPGDDALFIDPYYATYPGTIRAVSARPVAIATRPEAAFLPTLQDFGSRACSAKSLLINTPNNPTGKVYPRATLEMIAELCAQHDLTLISDEVYDTQVWNGTHLSPRALPGMAARTLVVGSLSKSHAMTGSRLGWLVGPAEAIAALATLALFTTYGVPGYIQDAARFALAQGTGLEAEISAPFARRRTIVLRLLAAQTAVRASPPDGAMYVLLDVRATGLSGDAFAEALLRAERIAVMPGESFGRAAAGHVRVALTLPDAALEDAVRRLLAFAGRASAAA